MNDRTGDPKRCSTCGEPFTCGARSATCWCTAWPALPREALDASRDCRCPRCLDTLVRATLPQAPRTGG